MAEAITTTRRSLFAAAAAVPFFTGAAATASQAAAGSDLEAEYRRIVEATRAFDASPTTTERDWDVLDTRRQQFFSRVENLAPTPQNAAIKAKAILLIHPEGFHGYYEDDHCTNTRLVRQVLHALTGVD